MRHGVAAPLFRIAFKQLSHNFQNHQLESTYRLPGTVARGPPPLMKEFKADAAFLRKIENHLLLGEKVICTAVPYDNLQQSMPPIPMTFVLVFLALIVGPFTHPFVKFLLVLFSTLFVMMPLFAKFSKPAFILVCTNRRVLFCDDQGTLMRTRSFEEIGVKQRAAHCITLAERAGEYTTYWLLIGEPAELKLVANLPQIASLS
jgi:hypothetical protein